MRPRGLAISDLLSTDPTDATEPASSGSQTVLDTSAPLQQPPSNDLVDIRPQLSRLTGFPDSKALVPRSIQENLDTVLQYLESKQELGRATIPSISSQISTASDSTIPPKRTTNVAINRITTLEVLYEYPVGHIVEYPETSQTGSIGHLFQMDPDDWQDPTLNIAYSRGGRMGQSLSGATVTCLLLVDAAKESVPCSERHTTCEGCKICPNSNERELTIPHTKASREDVRERLRKDRDDRLQYVSPSRDIFLKTSAFLVAIEKLGCGRPLMEVTNLSATEEEARNVRDLYLHQTQRGYRRTEGLCGGRIVFDYDDNGRPYISCEHYNSKTNKDHLHDHSIDNGSYHLQYIEAVITGDEQEAAQIEDAVFSHGYGPLADCSTVTNCSQQKAYCPFPHRDGTANLAQPIMKRLGCSSKFRVFEPKQEARRACPFVLIVTSGAHPHPVPLPTKTPPQVRTKLMEILGQLAEDLPDITPRRFIRHPIVRSFLTAKFPLVVSPTLADLHVSLSNRSHIQAYIKQAIEQHCVVNLKAQQDAALAPEHRYIRRIITIPFNKLPRHEDDDEAEKDNKDDLVRIIICMSPEGCRRLLSMGRYLQSDIAFRRIMAFLEFELACMARDPNTSLIFCRVYINRQNAAAHQRVFEEIEAIVKEDTGMSLKWRHLHAEKADGSDGYKDMILSWTADQHRGQAKGLGLHLQKLASQMPLKADLYEPGRNIQDLDPYEHLRRTFRVCVVHDFRNIKKCAVSDEVRWLMRSLVCIEHDDWDGTLSMIREKGGKAGNDWLNDKISSKFFFPGICWELSFIPIEIWNAGDSHSNLIESVHRDVNREGVHCTLLGGLKKGQFFDNVKMNALITQESYGINPSYKTGHISENAYHNLKRKSDSQHRVLAEEDQKIERCNERLVKSLDDLVKAENALHVKEQALCKETRPEKRQKLEEEVGRKLRAEERARKAFEKQRADSSLLKKGSGRIRLTIPE
ncbi:hypothetical protein C8R47DRAFT_1303282 [Mycena vitilis]|nr:hypothetical protein C8R47DRAFT_1303282 [Mycena vitilis]